MKATVPRAIAIMALCLAALCMTATLAQAQGSKSNQQDQPLQTDDSVQTRITHAPSTALRFTADDQHVQVANSDAIDMISGPLTIEAWVRPEAGILARGYSSIVSKQLGGTGYMLATNVGPETGHRFKSEVGGLQVTSNSQPAIDGWQHIAAVWDEGHLTIYANGQFDGVIDTGPPIPNTLPLWIGSSPFGGDTSWRGTIDEVRIWSVARTQAEIQSTMNGYLCGDERGLRAYWSFDEGEGSDILDTSGSSNGTTVGTAWVPGVVLTMGQRCRNKVTVDVVIDGRSRLILRKNTAQWHHLDFAAPGRWGFSSLPTIINGEEWFPVWPDVPDAENRFCSCYSSIFKGVLPGVHHKQIPAALKIRLARGVVSIVQYPSVDNDHALTVEFDDNADSGADRYLIELTFPRRDRHRQDPPR